MNPRAPSGSRASRGAQPGEAPSVGRVLAELDRTIAGARNSPAELVELLAELARRTAVISARLLEAQIQAAIGAAGSGGPIKSSVPPDRLLTAKEAAGRLGVGVRWVYSHADEIPGTKRLSRRKLRISKRGLERFLATREGRRVG